MDDAVLNAICHRNISWRKPNYKNILSYTEKSAVSKIDLTVVKNACSEMITNGIID